MTMPDSTGRLNDRLAKLLGLGTWLACAFIALGMILPLTGLQHLGKFDFVLAGIALLIALPTMRVAAMALWFFLQRDLQFAFVAVLVFTIIMISALIGATAG